MHNLDIPTSVHGNGFTLIELLVTIGIVAIIAAIGLPSYRYVTASNRLAKEVSDLHNSIELARSYALKTGLPMIVCPANANATACASTSNWSQGWIVAAASTECGSNVVNTPPVHITDKISANDTATFTPVSSGHAWLCFNRMGTSPAGYSGEFVFDIVGGNGSYRRCMVISATGLTNIMLYGQTDNVSGVMCQ